MVNPHPMRVLCVLSPSNQMYSGIGRAIFELATRLTGRVRFEFAMGDHSNTRNLEVLRRFCDERGFPLHVGRGRAEPGSLDTFNDDLPGLLRRRHWDMVECVCWANAATNEGVLAELGDAPLCYTPHDQPVWTVPMSTEQAAHIDRVHRRMLDRADLVCCDSPHERELLQETSGRDNARFLPLGCDFAAFQPGPPRRRDQLLFVGDLAEPRKRFDRVLAVFSRLVEMRPTIRLVVVGNRSDEVRGLIPDELRHACELRGYVSEAELRRAYAESAGLILMSEFEAFGIPILEALASGTPVFLSHQEATRSLFGRFPAAHFCPADRAQATAEIIAMTLSKGRDAVAEVVADRGRLRATFDWEVLAERKWEAMRAAWFRRNCWARSA